MTKKPLQDRCPEPVHQTMPATEPHIPPIYLASVYRCHSPQQAEALLTGAEEGYVYARDGHPNAAMLAERCRELHGAERAAIAATGMGAIALVLLSQLEQGEHIVVSKHLYGASFELLTREAARFGIESTAVDTCDVAATRAAMQPNTRLLAVETITNPLLRVSDLPALAEIARAHDALLLADNSFASPAVCRPLEHGADLVMESLTKIINGHSDIVLGLVCGAESKWQRVPLVLSRWGLSSSAMDCYLALRGLGTLALRARQACENALAAAEFLEGHPQVESVLYPGLASHADHELARRQFAGQFGWMVSFTLQGGRAAAERFIAAGRIPFCPSLGELSTTLSHPQSTSHRQLSQSEQQQLGITGGMIRLSVGIESREAVLGMLEESLAARAGDDLPQGST